MVIYDVDGNPIVSNNLQSKSILAIGDSFVKGDTLEDSQTWLHKMANRNGMTYYNKGINGASLAYSTNESYTSIMENYESIINSVSAPDYVVVLVGHNDANASLHGGTAIPIGTNADAVNTTFKGALNILITALLNAYPAAHILFMSPFNRRSIESDYASAIEDVTGIYSIPFYDCYERSTVCFQNSSQKTLYELSNSLHLNEAGQERFSYIVENQLKLLV